MTAPRDILSAMAAGTPGILAAGVWGLDGTPAELLTFEAGFPVESVIPEITVAAKLFLYLCRKLGEDRLDEFMVSGERYTVLAALPAPDRCVALFLRQGERGQGARPAAPPPAGAGGPRRGRAGERVKAHVEVTVEVAP